MELPTILELLTEFGFIAAAGYFYLELRAERRWFITNLIELNIKTAEAITAATEVQRTNAALLDKAIEKVKKIT